MQMWGMMCGPGGGWDELRDWERHMCTPLCKTDGRWEPAASHRADSSLFSDDLEGWDGVGWVEAQEGGDDCVLHTADSLHRTAETSTAL